MAVYYDLLASKYLEETTAALMSLDVGVMRAHCSKWGITAPPDDEVLLCSMHKDRAASLRIPMPERSASKAWLKERGMSSMDDGDVP